MEARMRPDNSNRKAWVGRVLTALTVLFLLFDSVIKLLEIAPVVDAFGRLGYLLTGFLGGAVASHLRIGDPLFSHVLFPTYVGALLWAGLLLRDERLRAIFSQKGAVR
jgi:hypothetical protein